MCVCVRVYFVGWGKGINGRHMIFVDVQAKQSRPAEVVFETTDQPAPSDFFS